MSKKRIYTWIGIIVFINVIVIGGLCSNHSQNKTLHAYQQLLQKQNQQTPSDNIWLNQLNLWQERFSLLQKSDAAVYRLFGLTQAYKLRQHILQRYTLSIKQNLIPYLEQKSLSALNNETNKAPLRLFEAIKAATDASSKNANTIFLQHWFNDYTADIYHKHINFAVSHNLVHFHVPQTLIKKQKKQLQRLSSATLLYLLYQDHYGYQYSKVFSKPLIIHGINFNQLHIRSLFDRHHFKTIYTKSLPMQIVRFNKGNHITGPLHLDINHKNKSAIIKQAQAQYLLYYQKAWRSVANHISIQSQPSLKTFINLINELEQNSKAIWPVLSLINDNATLKSTAPTALSLFLSHDQGFDGFQAALYTLKNEAIKLEQSHSNEKAYDTVRKRITNASSSNILSLAFAVANKLPSPISSWLNTLCKNLWALEMQAAHHYLSHIWQQQVWPSYDTLINNRFPIFKTSQNDISAENFNTFFGPGGTINSFFSYYLKPFVDTLSHYWRFKYFDGVNIGISQNNLDMLIRASLIQKMFYQDNPNALAFRFSLSPHSFSTNTQSIALNMGGQMFNATAKSNFSNSYVWPGSDGLFVTLRFHDINGSLPTQTLTGIWSWLRLIDNNRIITTNDPSIYFLHLKLGNDSATLKLIADQKINPYIPNILDQFRLTPSL